MRIFYDVDNQNDFIKGSGALPVHGAEALIPNLEALTRYAERHGIPILGSVDRHFGTRSYKNKEEEELSIWGGPFQNHCMDGTEGQKKIPGTLLRDVVYIGSPRGLLSRKLDAQQVIFEKQSYDVFHSPGNLGGNRNIARALRMLDATEAVLYGVATDYCVKAAALGMRRLLGKKIDLYVVTDAIKPVSPETEKEALNAMGKVNVQFVTAKDVIGN
ncbi:MAG: cysteine hydrolase [Candidatus Aenigmarchaeota archaeon]|nr:cysteine hydrolase [Candidatus Aenigmarchaeota archaeon]